jgi:hypothetical protein
MTKLTFAKIITQRDGTSGVSGEYLVSDLPYMPINGWKVVVVRKLMHIGVGRRRTAGIAAALAAACLAGSGLLAGSALASSPVKYGTQTNITHVEVVKGKWASQIYLKVTASVTAMGGMAPMGDVTISGGSTRQCSAKLGSASGLTSTGSCELRDMPLGSDQVQANYKGRRGLGNSSSAGVSVTLGAKPALTAHTPPLKALAREHYRYTFAARGLPAPKFALAPGAPKWLHLNKKTGLVSGRIPGISSFRYSVVVSNALGEETIGPFIVSVS